jgi:hypothetical protein
LKDRRRAEDVLLDQPLDAVDHPRQFAYAGNHFGVGKQSRDRRHPRAPRAAGVKNDLGGAIGVEIVEQATQDALALDVVEEDRILVASAHLAQQGAEQFGQRAGHAGFKAWVLP